jgi:crotonobetainyl-CoA:carnitine CoA-transferase CaiB-like acyl-CoA transferase
MAFAPISGVSVVDFTGNAAGPAAGMLPALGAS